MATCYGGSLHLTPSILFALVFIFTIGGLSGVILAKRLYIMDRVYNTEMDKYKDLRSKDQKLKKGKISEDYNYMYDNISFVHQLN